MTDIAFLCSCGDPPKIEIFIARRLKVSRTTLIDHIKSRGLE